MQNSFNIKNGANIASGGTGTVLGDLTVNSNRLDFHDGSTTVPVVTTTSTDTLSNKTLVAPALGTPVSGVATNLTGTAASLTAGNVTTNANLTGPITSVGNATAVANLAITNAMIAAGTIDLAAKVTGVLPVANGGTASASVVSAPAATAWAGWDANSNLSAFNHIEGYATTATAAATTTLLVGSKFQQYFTGTTTQTVLLPVTSTLVLGQSFTIVNNSTGAVTVQSSGANTIQVMAASTQLVVTCILTSGTGVASWSAAYGALASSIAGIAPTVQKFTSGTAQTYTTPAGVQYIRVRMVGGGAGGNGGGDANGGAGGAGVTTTFGTSLLTCTGGNFGTGTAGSTAAPGGTGGTATINSPAIGTSMPGGTGTGASTVLSTGGASGGPGGGTPFSSGGGGGAGAGNTVGQSGATNSGAGGGGGSGTNGATHYPGAGGGGGAYIDALIVSPSATYSYTVGTGGAGGTGGSSNPNGGAGAAGYIEVTEYYTNLAIGTSAAVTANYVMAGPTSGAAAAPTFRALTNADAAVIPACRYYGSNTTIGTGDTIIIHPTVVYDNASLYNTGTGTLTASRAGRWLLTTSLLGPSLSWTAGTEFRASAYVNGSVDSYIFNVYANTTYSGRLAATGSTVLTLAASDTVLIKMLQVSSAAIDVTNNYRDFFTFTWLGN